jgi:hypothetical protein
MTSMWERKIGRRLSKKKCGLCGERLIEFYDEETGEILYYNCSSGGR